MENMAMHTDTDSRMIITGIRNGTTEEMLYQRFKDHGNVQIHTYVPGRQNNGWAWVGFDNRESVQRMLDVTEVTNGDKELLQTQTGDYSDAYSNDIAETESSGEPRTQDQASATGDGNCSALCDSN